MPTLKNYLYRYRLDIDLLERHPENKMLERKIQNSAQENVQRLTGLIGHKAKITCHDFLYNIQILTATITGVDASALHLDVYDLFLHELIDIEDLGE
jgi:hypothetical protein